MFYCIGASRIAYASSRGRFYVTRPVKWQIKTTQQNFRLSEKLCAAILIEYELRRECTWTDCVIQRFRNVGRYHAFSKCSQYVICKVRQTITECDPRVSQFCVLTVLVGMGPLSNYVGAADPSSFLTSSNID